MEEDLFEGSSDIDEFNAHLRLDQTASKKLEFQYEFYATNYKAAEVLESPITTDVFSESEFDQNMVRPEIRATYSFKPKHTLITGVGFAHENLDRTFLMKRSLLTPNMPTHIRLFPIGETQFNRRGPF